jgi:hypothetical protein
VIHINRARIFTLAEARIILPVIRRITLEAKVKTHTLLREIEKASESSQRRVVEIEDQVNAIIEKWQEKIEKLGAKVGGLWIVDFDKGDGYFCWKHTEPQIEFWHGYQEGYSSRKTVDQEPISHDSADHVSV